MKPLLWPACDDPRRGVPQHHNGHGGRHPPKPAFHHLQVSTRKRCRVPPRRRGGVTEPPALSPLLQQFGTFPVQQDGASIPAAGNQLGRGAGDARAGDLRLVSELQQSEEGEICRGARIGEAAAGGLFGRRANGREEVEGRRHRDVHAGGHRRGEGAL